MAIHVAITRKIIPGKEEAFEAALKKFMGQSFTHDGVHGAMMITSLKEDGKNEIGILRSFKDEEEKNAFYNSQLFKEWEAYASTLTEDAVYKNLSGLEAWFRTASPPPRWKMAVATLCGVFPVSLFLNYIIAPFLPTMPLPLRLVIISALMVAILTWGVMPLVTRLLKPWLQKGKKSS